ncbi:MAG: hypothetical protein ACRELX_00140, partial [Longimicrobiales bacterium]
EHPVIELILSRSFLQELRDRMQAGSVLVVAPTDRVAEQIRVALSRGQIADGREAPRVIASERGRLLDPSADVECVFLWPGTPAWVQRELESRDCVIPAQCISDESLIRVRIAVLDTALRDMADRERLSTSSGDALRGRTAGAVEGPRPD